MDKNIEFEIGVIPAGKTCRFENGYYCPNMTTNPGNGQKWCSLFDQERPKTGGLMGTVHEKCQICRAVTEQVNGGQR